MWYQRIPTLSEKAIKMFFPFLVTYLCECRFSSDTLSKAIFCNKLNAEVAVFSQIIKEIFKNVNQCQSSILPVCWKICLFSILKCLAHNGFMTTILSE